MPNTEGRFDPATKRLLIALIAGVIAPVLDTTIVAIGLHTLVEKLHADIATIQWISTGYLLALAITIPFVGWAQARFGGKRLWIFALSLFLVGSALCALAWNAESLVLFRVIQGLGGGIMFPLLQTLAMQATSKLAKNSMGKTMAIVSLPIAIAPIFGPVLGGLVLNGLDWPWLFLINLPIGAVALMLAVRFVPTDLPNTAKPRLDAVGVILLAPSLAGLLYGLTNVHLAGGFTRSDVLIPLIGGAVLLAAFVLWALRKSDALIDVRLFAKRSVSSSSIVLVLLGGPMFAGMLLLPLYWQNLRGVDVLGAALLLIPQGVGALAARSVAGSLTDKIGSRWVAVLGALVIAASTLPFALLPVDTNTWVLGAVLFIRGFGLGTVFIPVMVASMVELKGEDIPHAAMLTRIVQQVGGSFMTAIVAVVLQAGLTGSNPADAFATSFWWLTGITVLAGMASLLLPTRKPVQNEPSV